MMKRYFLLCWFLCPSVLAQQPSENRGTEAPITSHFISQALKVTFTLGDLGLGTSGNTGLPSHPGHLCLLLEPPSPGAATVGFYGTVKTRVLHRLSELRGRVQITSPEAALAFVRLPTSPATCYMLDRREEVGYTELEVVRKGQDMRPLSYGLRWLAAGMPLEQWRHFPEGRYGLLSTARAKQLGIDFAQVSVSGTGYRIERTLVVSFSTQRTLFTASGHYLIKTQEWVGPDGEYRIEKNDKIMLPMLPGVKWEFPWYSIM